MALIKTLEARRVLDSLAERQIEASFLVYRIERLCNQIPIL